MLTQIERMASEGVPTKIDQYFLTNMAGGTQNHFRHALRVLGLIDENNRTTDLLRDLVAADEDTRKSMLAGILTERFPEMVQLGTDASKSDFLEVLAAYGAKSGDSQRKALTFYVAAAEWSGLPISNHVKSGRAPSSSPRRAAPRRARNSGNGTQGNASGVTPAATGTGEVVTVDFGDAGRVVLNVDVRWLQLDDSTFSELRKNVNAMKALATRTPANAAGQQGSPNEGDEA